MCVCVSVCPCVTLLFVPQGINIYHTQERGGKHFCIKWGVQTFFVVGCGGYDDVDEEIDVSEASFLVSEANVFASEANFFVSEANILVSKASKLSIGARIFRGP